MYNFSNMPSLPNMPNMPNMPNKEETHYSVLNVLQNASYDDIKKAYRKLSLEYHPDRNGGNNDKSEKFKKITDAYKILGDESERRKYDFLLKSNLTKLNIDPSLFDIQGIFTNILNNINNDIVNGASGANCCAKELNGGGFPFGNIYMGKGSFNSILDDIPDININRGFSQHEYKSKPPTISKTININILQAYTGCKLPINITRWIIEADRKHEETETIYIDIPKGVDNNEIITIENKGNSISNTNKSNVKIKILIKNDSLFDRVGVDLVLKKSITLKESFCGFSFDLTYIDGREFKINNEAGNIIPPNFTKIIPNLGMQRDDTCGNLIIEFDVIYPKKLTTEQVSELENIL